MSNQFYGHKKAKCSIFDVQEVVIKAPSKTTDMWEYGRGVTSDKIKIATWNVNGIRSLVNRRRLIPYLEANQIDILCVNETKINYDAFVRSPIKVHGYSGYWNFCKMAAGYSGVAIFSRFLPISMIEDMAEEKHSQEGRIITL
jgi:hypothetical protein